MDMGFGEGEWTNITTEGEFIGKTIKSMSDYPRWDRENKATVITFEFTDGSTGELSIFWRAHFGEAAEDQEDI